MILALVSLLVAAEPGEPGYRPPGLGTDLYRPEWGCASMGVVCPKPTGKWATGATLSWANRPLLYTKDNTELAVIDQLLVLQLGAGGRIGPIWLDVNVPTILFVSSDYAEPTFLRLGDPSLQGRLAGEPVDGFDLGVYGRLVVPAGSDRLGVGEEGLSGRVGLSAGFQPGPLQVELSSYLLLRRHRYEDGLWVGDMVGLQGSVAVDLPLRPAVETWIELGPVQAPTAGTARGEVLGSLSWKGWTVGAGAGVFPGPGTPAWRIVVRGSLDSEGP